MVSVLAFYSDDPSSIPAEVYNFFCKIVVEKNENKQKEAGVGPIFKKTISKRIYLTTIGLSRVSKFTTCNNESATHKY